MIALKNINTKLKTLGSNNALMFLVAIMCVFLTSTILGLGDWDYVWQTKLGQAVVVNHDFFGVDKLVWGTKNLHPYYDHEWLTNVFFYFMVCIFGETASVIVIKVLVELILGITAYYFVKTFIGDFTKLSFSSYISCMLLSYTLATLLVKTKAYVLSLIFVMWLIIVLEKRKQGSSHDSLFDKTKLDTFKTISFPKFSIFIICITLLWNNIHSGSISLLFAITGLYWLLYWRDLKTAILGIVCVVALGINPYGYKLIYFDFTHASDSAMKAIIRDWHMLDLSMIAGKAICAMIVLIIIHLLHIKKTYYNYVYIVLFLVFFVMTLSSMRHYLYMYPIGLILVIKGQYENPKSINIKTFGVPTWFIFAFTTFLLVLFGFNFDAVSNEYTMSYVSESLNTLLDKTNSDTNDGLFTGDVNVWSSGYKAFQSGAFPHVKERVLDSYTLLTGSEVQIKNIIDYYDLTKFLFYKTESSVTGYKLNTNLYDYLISRPDEYVLLYDDNVLVYFVNKEVYDAIK